MDIPPNIMESDSATTLGYRIALLSLRMMVLGGHRKGGPIDGPRKLRVLP